MRLKARCRNSEISQSRHSGSDANSLQSRQAKLNNPSLLAHRPRGRRQRAMSKKLLILPSGNGLIDIPPRLASTLSPRRPLILYRAIGGIRRRAAPRQILTPHPPLSTPEIVFYCSRSRRFRHPKRLGGEIRNWDPTTAHEFSFFCFEHMGNRHGLWLLQCIICRLMHGVLPISDFNVYEAKRKLKLEIMLWSLEVPKRENLRIWSGAQIFLIHAEFTHTLLLALTLTPYS